MCGRISQKSSRSDFKNYVYRFEPLADLNRPNIKPTQSVQIVANNRGSIETIPARWWFQKENAKEFKTEYTTFNARSDKIQTSFLYKKAIEQKRCLVPITSFYEWSEKGKPPYEIFMAETHPFALAGLWSSYSENGDPKQSFTIITCEPNDFMTGIHNRMPVILDSTDAQQEWLEAGNYSLLKPFAGNLFAQRLSASIEKTYPTNEID